MGSARTYRTRQACAAVQSKVTFVSRRTRPLFCFLFFFPFFSAKRTRAEHAKLANERSPFIDLMRGFVTGPFIDYAGTQVTGTKASDEQRTSNTT